MAWKCKESGDMTASFFKIISTFPTQKKNMVNKAPQDFVGQKTVAKPFPFRWMFLYLMPQFSSFGGGGRNHSLIPILSPQSSSIMERLATSDFDSPQKRHNNRRKGPKGWRFDRNVGHGPCFRPSASSWKLLTKRGVKMQWSCMASHNKKDC